LAAYQVHIHKTLVQMYLPHKKRDSSALPEETVKL